MRYSYACMALTVGLLTLNGGAPKSAYAQDVQDYEQPGRLYDPANIQADLDRPIQRLVTGECRKSRLIESDRTFKGAGTDWQKRWRFAEDADVNVDIGFSVVSGYRYMLGTIVDYDLDGIDDYARVVIDKDRNSAILVRFGASKREPVLLNSELGSLNGQAIRGTEDGCLVVSFPESGTVSYFMEGGSAKAVYIDDG